MTTLFGIKNCDTVKKAKSWLEEHNIDYSFHDLRANGLSLQQVQSWLDVLGAEQLVNKRSTTWKQLSSEEQTRTLSDRAAAVILANPTLIKRPVLELNNELYVGFKVEQYEALF